MNKNKKDEDSFTFLKRIKDKDIRRVFEAEEFKNVKEMELNMKTLHIRDFQMISISWEQLFIQ